MFTVYVIVEVGEALTSVPMRGLMLMLGDQLYVLEFPVAVKVVEPPLQMALGEMATEG